MLVKTVREGSHGVACAQDYPMLLGNLVAILFSALIVVVVSLIKPDNYDWKGTREIAMVDDSETGTHEASSTKYAQCVLVH